MRSVQTASLFTLQELVAWRSNAANWYRDTTDRNAAVSGNDSAWHTRSEYDSSWVASTRPTVSARIAAVDVADDTTTNHRAEDRAEDSAST